MNMPRLLGKSMMYVLPLYREEVEPCIKKYNNDVCRVEVFEDDDCYMMEEYCNKIMELQRSRHVSTSTVVKGYDGNDYSIEVDLSQENIPVLFEDDIDFDSMKLIASDFDVLIDGFQSMFTEIRKSQDKYYLIVEENDYDYYLVIELV